MSLYELEARFSVGPIQLGRKIGHQIEEFPQSLGSIKVSHRAPVIGLNMEHTYPTHELPVTVLNEDEVELGICEEGTLRRCIEGESTLPIVLRKDQINNTDIINRLVRWIS